MKLMVRPATEVKTLATEVKTIHSILAPNLGLKEFNVHVWKLEFHNVIPDIENCQLLHLINVTHSETIC